jgi:MFS family permease
MKLWTGKTISWFGSALSRLAIPLIATLTLNATASEMGLLSAAGTAPALVIGLFTGAWVDRFGRRRLLILGDLGRALLLITIPIAVYLQHLSMIQLYFVIFLSGALGFIFNVASQAYLPSVIERHQLVEGNSKLELSGSITAVAGPSLAGWIIQLLTAPLAILLDAISYLVSAFCIISIKHREDPIQILPAPILDQVREGLRIVFGNPVLRSFAGCMATSNFMSNAFFALYILFGTRQLGLDAAQLGLVYGVGALVAPRVARRFGIGRAVVLGALLGAAEVVPVVFATPRNAVPLLIFSSMLGNFGWVLYNVNETSIRQAITPLAQQGRMNATMGFIVSGILPLGALVGGSLGDMIGLRETIALAAIGSLLSVLWVAFSPVRRLVRAPDGM